MSEYVTVVQVDIQQPKIAHIIEPKLPPPSSFVTVLSINNGQSNTMTINTSSDNPTSGEIVTVYRLPGERLGFGLKFQGGTKTNEQVERLFIQSCDVDSPASRARASWGALGEGDEILEIDHEPITKMTRIECVKCLKDRNVSINLLVRKADRNSMTIVRNDSFNGTNKRPLPPSPPKVPPRKIVTKKPPPIPKVVEIPVVAENYLNSLDDDSISMNFNDESDETGSTISSQISVISNFSSESDLSLLSTANAASSDLTRILTKPFQMIEREFNVNGNSNGGNTNPIDNLLLFNDLEQPNNNSYVNVSINEDTRYENVDMKKMPPTPLPRGSISSSSSTSSLPQETSRSSSSGEIDSKTPTKTIESWLNDAAINRSGNDKNSVARDNSRVPSNYEPIKFEYFASVDDEEEKLGPSSELLNISEAYFNFPWCANLSNALQLPTIGEAEEEFSSMEQQRVTVNTGPIFIFHDDTSNGISETDSKQQICHRSSMEINNNTNSPYLHASEDKSDNLSEEKIHDESRNIHSTDARGSQEIKSLSKSLRGGDCNKDIIMATTSGIDACAESHNEHVTKSTEVNKVHENVQVLIKSESLKIEIKDIEEVTKDEKISIKPQSELKTEKTSATTTSQSFVYSHSTNVHISDEKMDHPQLFPLDHKVMMREDNENMSRMQADEKEITSANRTTVTTTKTIINSKNDNNSATNDFSSSKTTKATAIVAPQRKTYNFDEIKNFTDSKPPFKSATLGRPTRPTLNWRNKDEKSEKSVKDKIAMFSNSTSDISLIIPKQTYKDKSNGNGSMRSTAKSIENIFAADTMKSASRVSKKKAMSMENLDDFTDEEEVKSYTPVSKPMSLHTRPPLLMMSRAQSVEHLMSTPSLPLRPPPPPSTAPVSLERRISFNGYVNEENRQKSIANILENRKKNISKLRGLVIPDKVPENDLHGGQKVFDLPVIRSKECDLIRNIPATPTAKFTRRTFSDFESPSVRPRTVLRKEFLSFEDDRTKTTPPIKPPRTSLIIGKSNATATDESDSESYLSSRISTPPISPVAKKPLVRTLSSNSSLSSNSTLTSGSGSQASCSSNGSGSPENRKNNSEAPASRKSIVASSKSRSGRECLDKSWRDEDSTDGGIDDDNKQRVSKVKTRSMTNYKLAGPGDNLVDKVINVATYVEVMSSDSEEKNETSSSSSTQKTVINEVPPSDLAKWVRNEASKAEVPRKIPKSLETPKKMNLSEIRRNFEKQTAPPPPPPIMSPRTPTKEKIKISHNRYSSWDSIASSSSGVSSELLGTGTGTNNSELLQTNQSDFGSFSSFGSSHSLITPQDLQLIIDEADPPLETSEAFVVVLQRESPESSIGITLAGGSDYEAKEITIHRILANSPADKDGRLKRGDRLLSINGLSMRGLTHRESLSVLKSPRMDVVMVVTRSKSAVKTKTLTKSKLGSLGSLIEKVDGSDERNASRSIDLIQNGSHKNGLDDNDLVTIIKDGTGIGISLDGGYDSPAGNKPLIIKKIFMGGAAEKLTNLKAGDEIIEINGLSTERQTRIDVWNMIKKLPQGDAVQLRIKRK